MFAVKSFLGLCRGGSTLTGAFSLPNRHSCVHLKGKRRKILRLEAMKIDRECRHFVPGSLYQWRHEQRRHVWQKRQTRHEPTFFLVFLGKTRTAWLRSKKLKFGEKDGGRGGGGIDICRASTFQGHLSSLQFPFKPATNSFQKVSLLYKHRRSVTRRTTRRIKAKEQPSSTYFSVFVIRL